MATRYSRRTFLKTTATAGAGLTLAFHLTGCGRRGVSHSPRMPSSGSGRMARLW